jgi:hypothetical protein
LLGAVKDNQPIEVSAWLAESPPQINAELRDAIRGMLARIIGWERPTLRRLPRQIPPDLVRLEVSETAVLSQILRNTLFCKVYSYPFDLTTAGLRNVDAGGLGGRVVSPPRRASAGHRRIGPQINAEACDADSKADERIPQRDQGGSSEQAQSDDGPQAHHAPRFR